MKETTPAPVEVSNQWVFNTLTTALEGGSNYWIQRTEIASEAPLGAGRWFSEKVAFGAMLKIMDPEGEWHHLHRVDMAVGLGKYLTDALSGNTATIHSLESPDGTESDMLLQYALWGKVVYG